MSVDLLRRGMSPAAAIRPRNLLLTLGELAPLLDEAARRGDRLNTFLLSAGMSQIADDHCGRGRGRLAETAAHLEATGRANLARVTAGLVSGTQSLRERMSPAVAEYQQELRRCVAAAASAFVAQSGVDLPRRPPVPPELRRDLLRLPACFHAFDQHPEDVERLVDAFARRQPDRTRTLLVFGVRTSGSYLAPLCAAYLRLRGYADVGVVTGRPGHALAAADRCDVRACAASDGVALVIDDAPGTGRSLWSAARMLERLGLRPGSIVIVAPLFAGRELPPLLDPYDSVVLTREEWQIESRLAPESVADDLTRLFGSSVELEPVALPERGNRRGHRRALFRVRSDDDSRTVLAEGAGLGYFGGHALAVADSLGSRLPAIYGLSGGVLYREWLADVRDGDALARAVAEYVAARSEAFAVGGDVSERLAGQAPAWEVVSGLLSRAFLRAWPVARLAFLDRAAQLLLRPARPAVVDGNTSRPRWFATGDGPEGFTKVGFADRSFWHLGLTCFDPVFDLAGVDPGGSDDRLAREMRRSYEERTGEAVDAERWMLYQLAHLWGRRRTHPGEEPALRRASARALQRYFAEVLPADAAPHTDGALCAIDLDGVLETEALGVPATSTAGARALRALARHGFRPVIASGRSAPEVAERCACYGLAGGVAEYGAVVHDAEHSRRQVLLPDGAARMLDELRTALAEESGVEIDTDYEHSVRAYRRVGESRRGLTEEMIARTARGAPVRVIRGEGQTDFVPAQVDKGTGLRALADALGSEVALAVGDTASDLPMFALAERAFAPASADSSVRRAGIELVRRPYQAGLAEAVGRFLGHAPGGCPVCRLPAVTRRTKLLLDLLSAQESGPAGAISSLPRLAWKVRAW